LLKKTWNDSFFHITTVRMKL